MNKNIIILFLGFASAVGFSVQAQTQSNALNATGSVGIGTTSPSSSYRLDIQSFDGGGARIYRPAGAVGLRIEGISGSSQIQFGDGSTLGASSAWSIGRYNSDNSFRISGSDGVGGNDRLVVATSGYVGIGTSSPTAKLEVNGGVFQVTADDYTQGYVSVNPGGAGYAGHVDWYKTGHVRLGYIGFQDIAGSQNNLALNLENGASFIVGNGNVGIGTANPTQKLSVNGSIRTKEVIVDTGWADYVFADNYKLKPLSEVEQQIKSDKHLPGIPSAAEVAEKGISVGEMQAKLLAKIEELTLHQISQEKRQDSQEVQIAAQALRIVELEKENTQLKSALLK
jgi:hypothetical protein